ncbi:MAG TPA: gfo/Idh/MocA family oxidoreductase, partial [Armatimonadota bacterium]
PHKRDFLSCVRTGERPKADVEVGVASTLLCHLGNIAYRTGHVLNTDPKTGHIRGDRKASALWKRAYRPGWEPKA